MKNEWQALKAQKEKELPIAQAAREEFLKKHVDKFEKQVLKKARKQEAGTTMKFSYRRGFFWYVFGEFFCDVVSFGKFDSVNNRVETMLVRRLEGYGISAEDSFRKILVTLP